MSQQQSTVRTIPAVIGAAALAALAGFMVWLVVAYPGALRQADRDASVMVLIGAGFAAFGSFILFMVAATGKEPE